MSKYFKKTNLVLILILAISMYLAKTVNAAPESSGQYRAAFTKTSPSNLTTGLTTTNVKLQWSATSNVFQYRYCYYSYDLTNNVCDLADKSTWKSNGTSTSVTLPTLTLNKTYYWQIGAKLNDSSFIYADGALSAKWSFTVGANPQVPVGEGIYDNTHGNWVYTGKWATYTGIAGPYGNTYKESRDIPDYATFAFTGSRAVLLYTQGPDNGVMNVYMDNSTTPTSINQSGALTWQKVWQSPSLTTGTHTVKLVYVSGNYVNIDAIKVFAQADLTAPGQITLSASSGVNSGTVTLNWKAVGDDGGSGAASSYLVRYSASPISDETAWGNATAVTAGIPTPKAAGQDESMTILGLTPGQTYYFAVRAQDEQFNIGLLSNSPSAPAKLLPPAEMGVYDDIAPQWNYSWNWTLYSGSGPYNNTLHQSNVKDAYAEMTFNGNQFMVKYLKASGRGSFDVVLDGSKVATIVANNSATVWQATWTSETLSAGEHTVRFVNTGNTWIDLDSIQIFGPDVTAPAAIANLSATAAGGNGRVNLAWTAVGDDGNTPGGAATAYLVRYSVSGITTQTDWDSATAVSSGIPTPKVQGQAETMTVSGLTPGQTYYFAIRARDEEGNLGGLSNSPSAPASLTPATTPGTYDDSDTTVWTYSGTWSIYSGSGPYNNTLHQNSIAGDYAEVTFNGAKFAVKYLKAGGRGSFDVVLDGSKVATIVANNSATVWQATWTSETLSAGEHTVRFVNTGNTWIDLDSIQIFAAPTGVGAGTYDDSDTNAWTYAGTWSTYSGSGPYNNTLHQNNVKGNYAEVVINGDQFVVTYLQASGRGSFDVYIDGIKVDTVVTNGSATVWQATWTSDLLSPGVHIIRFVNTGNGWIDLDAIEVITS